MNCLEKLIRYSLLTFPFAFASHAQPVPAPASFGYVLQADSFAKNKATAIQRLATSGRDWIVLDASFSGNAAWTPADLTLIRQGKPGRKIICYLSIGEAEDYRPYWHNNWVVNGQLTAAAPAWLGAVNPDWPGNYKVKYWAAGWQAIMLQALDSAMASGFDGVYLDIVDGFEYYEQDGHRFIDNRINPETGQSYRRDMVDWVKTFAAHTRTSNPAALVIPQNGPQLLEHADFLATISAIGIEDLFTNGNQLQPKGDTNYSLSFLKLITAVNKPVLLVEYPTTPARKTLVINKARQHGFVWLVTDRNLKTLGVSGF